MAKFEEEAKSNREIFKEKNRQYQQYLLELEEAQRKGVPLSKQPVMKPNETYELWFSDTLIDLWADKIFKDHDKDENGKLNKEEAWKGLEMYLKFFQMEKYLVAIPFGPAYDDVDVNKDGELSKPELKKFMEIYRDQYLVKLDHSKHFQGAKTGFVAGTGVTYVLMAGLPSIPFCQIF